MTLSSTLKIHCGLNGHPIDFVRGLCETRWSPIVKLASMHFLVAEPIVHLFSPCLYVLLCFKSLGSKTIFISCLLLLYFSNALGMFIQLEAFYAVIMSVCEEQIVQQILPFDEEETLHS